MRSIFPVTAGALLRAVRAGEAGCAGGDRHGCPYREEVRGVIAPHPASYLLKLTGNTPSGLPPSPPQGGRIPVAPLCQTSEMRRLGRLAPPPCGEGLGRGTFIQRFSDGDVPQGRGGAKLEHKTRVVHALRYPRPDRPERTRPSCSPPVLADRVPTGRRRSRRSPSIPRHYL